MKDCLIHFKENISTDEMNGLKLSCFNGEIYVIDTRDKLLRIIPQLKEQPVLGFDTETKPSFVKGVKHRVALIQLATADRAFLIRTKKIGIPDVLADILTDNRILKIGVAVRDDIRFLKGKKTAGQAGYIDLQQYVRCFGIQCASLKKLTAIILGFKISKRQQVSNWEADSLSHEQIVYAATDAWVCYEIYQKLSNLSV